MSNIPVGYKQTEVGVIPEDWDIQKLRAVCSMKSGEGITSANIDQFSKYPCYGGNGLRGFTTRFTHDGRYALIGRQGALCGNVLGVEGKLFASEHAIVVTASARTDMRWLTFVLGDLQLNQYSESSAQPGLSVSKILSLEIPLPPTKAEQTAIAAALSDADALITSLEKLIAKKRNIKQGAMQELLKPKEGWVVKRLGEIFTVTAGGDFDPSQSSSLQDETYTYPIYSNAISERGLYGYCSYNAHEANSITVTARGTLGAANYRDHKFTAIGRVLVLKPKEPSDCRFFSEFINNRIDFVVESTGVPQLTAPQISNYELPVPPLSEQTRIAAILSDMDADIEALEKKLEKYHRIKQGMMQELLTGKTRLV